MTYPKILLVSMPWASTVRPSLGVGTLVSVAKRLGFECRSYYPNLDFSVRLGIEAYECFADTPSLFALGEHLFAVSVFGAEALASKSFLKPFLRAVGKTRPAPSRSLNAIYHLRDRLVPQFLASCTEAILAANPDIVGFSCTFNQVIPSLAVAQRLRAHPAPLKILFGGACVHGPMGEAYARTFPQYIDHVFTGEADLTFGMFLQTLAEGGDVREIPGITAEGECRVPAVPVFNMDQVPTPDFHDFLAQRTALEQQGHLLARFANLPYESARGCWWGEKSHCTFCGLNNLGMQFRSRSPERVLDEVVTLATTYQTVSLMAADNILGHRSYRDLLPGLAKLGLDLKLFYEIKANVHRDDIAALAAAGVGWVQPGIESFSDHVLLLMRKGVTALQNVCLMKFATEFGITLSYNILVGFSGETDADYVEMIDLIQRIGHLPPPSGGATMVQVHRFSPFHASPEEFGLGELRPARYYRHLVPPDLVPASEIAYFFEHEPQHDGPMSRHLTRLNDLIDTWRTSTRRLGARLGPGFIEVLELAEDGETVRVLDLFSSLLLVLADEPTSIQKATRALYALDWHTISLDDVVQVVTSLAEAGWILVNGNRMVSSIPFERPHSESELAHWVERWGRRYMPAECPGSPVKAEGTDSLQMHADESDLPVARGPSMVASPS